jgi:hypothetical protein
MPSSTTMLASEYRDEANPRARPETAWLDLPLTPAESHLDRQF